MCCRQSCWEHSREVLEPTDLQRNQEYLAAKWSFDGKEVKPVLLNNCFFRKLRTGNDRQPGGVSSVGWLYQVLTAKTGGD